MRTHLCIPDTQCRPGVPTDHLSWIGRYILDIRPDVIVHLGDHADFPSLSTYDKGKKAFEGRRVKEDILAAKRGMYELLRPLKNSQKRAAANKKKLYKPEMHFTLGNHCHRADRAAENSPELDGLLGSFSLGYEDFGWTVHPFLQIAMIDGIRYAHYFYNPNSGQPYGGGIENRINKVGGSFTQGHMQGKLIGEIPRNCGRVDRGLIVGSCYMHDEDYKGPQGNGHWRGIVVKHEVEDGDYCLMEVSLDYLCRKYEQMRLSKFVAEKYPGQCPTLEGAFR